MSNSYGFQKNIINGRNYFDAQRWSQNNILKLVKLRRGHEHIQNIKQFNEKLMIIFDQIYLYLQINLKNYENYNVSHNILQYIKNQKMCSFHEMCIMFVV